MAKRTKNLFGDFVELLAKALLILLPIWVWVKTSSWQAALIFFVWGFAVFFTIIFIYKQWREKCLLDSGMDIIDSLDGVVSFYKRRP